MSSQTAGVHELLTLRPGVLSVRDQAGATHLVAGLDTEPLGRLDDDGELLRRLATAPRSADAYPDAEDELERLRARGWLAMTVTHGDRPLYTLVPERPPPHPQPEAPPGEEPELSRFAVLRREDDQLVLESPRAWCTIRLHDASVLPMLAPADARNAAVPPSLPPDVTARIQRDLWWAGMLSAPSSGPEVEVPLLHWSPHELWFYDRSRLRRADGRHGWGATSWARDVFPPLPAAREPFDGPTVALPKPDLATLRATDPSVTETIEARHSIRAHDDQRPMTAAQLGEFLYRCCRNRAHRRTEDGLEYLRRPYASGGSFYELEVYPVVRRVAGLEPGLYHYDPANHSLMLVRRHDRAVGNLLQATTWAAPMTGLPQVVLVLAARFGRMMWKYESMAYAVILRNVGALYQLMYTVATAMGLAPCALGGTGVDTFSQATGLDSAAEGSVGEFLLGSRPAAMSHHE